jgi:flagellar protein FliS
MNWKTAYLETRILSASPVELINILYEYAILSVQDARNGLARRDVAARSKAVLKVIAILGELESSLDHELGGEIASNLGRLYRYMRDRLTVANLQQADAPLAEVEALFKTLGEAWQVIGRDKDAATDDANNAKLPKDWNAFAMTEATSDYSAHTWSA